jgi:phage shock protein PspC (stress-responsive transcriptional regulator)/uncharacterized membrane protein
MKKIININLSGRVIPIEDTAYEKLQAYIESLRRYFAHEEGRDEIINDIEGRIAELMNEKVRKGAESITDTDVNDIAGSMGRPEDFEAEEKERKETYTRYQQTESAGTTSTAAGAETKTRKKNRLYRDTSDKFIGGVCSGIAAYLNVDPAIVRILFAIITFGGFGLGFLAYIIMWIVLPPSEVEGYTGKRLFRNPDEKMLGGVCSGLAAYFNKSTSTIRLIFLAPIILSIIVGMFDNLLHWGGGFDIFPNILSGSLTSTFVLAYIILWIVLPEARSPYQKMEMRGEKVDVNTIRQTVQDRAKDMGEDVKSAAKNFSEKAKEFSETRGKEFVTEVGQTIKPVTRGLGHAIGVLFKVFFLFIAGTIAFALFVTLMVIIFGGVAWWPVNNFLWTSKLQQFYAWGTLFLFLGVPLIGFLVWLIRRIIGIKSKSNYLGWTFGGLWTLGWVTLILFVASIMKDTRYFEENPAEITITQPANKLTVMVSEPMLEFTDRFWWIDSDSEGWNLTEDTVKLSLVEFTVDKSPDANYHVTLIKKSAGKSMRDAMDRAGKIQYAVISRDSVLDLGNGFAIGKESKYRGQLIELKILVPEGKKIRFDETITRKLNPTEIRVSERRGRLRKARIDIDYDWRFAWETNVDYTMGTDGFLIHPERPERRSPGDYRYNEEQQIKESIEEREKRIEEEKRKLEEEKRKLNDTIGNSTKKESLDDEEADTGVTGLPVFSLFQVFN